MVTDYKKEADMPCFKLKDGTKLSLQDDALNDPKMVEFLRENAAPGKAARTEPEDDNEQEGGMDGAH